MKKSEKKIVLVLGASRLGASIASLASRQGLYTVIVDTNREAFRKLDPSFSGFFVEGDAMEVSVLEKAHIREALEVDIVTGDDDTNILLANLVSRLYETPFINVRLIDLAKKPLLPTTNINVISPSSLSLELYQSLRQKELKA